MATHFDSSGNAFMPEKPRNTIVPFSNSAYKHGYWHPVPEPWAFYSPHSQFPTTQRMYDEYKDHEYRTGHPNYIHNSGMEGDYQYQSAHFRAQPNEQSFVPYLGHSDYESDVQNDNSKYHTVPAYGTNSYYHPPPIVPSAVGSMYISRVRYPNPDDIRYTSSLFRFIIQIPKSRRFDTLRGPRMDIVEEVTGEILCHAVPKRMLVLFFGRHAITPHLRTNRSMDASMFPQGVPPEQKFLVSAQSTSGDAWRILVAWMKRACGDVHRWGQSLRELEVPRRLFAAITLARTLRYMGLNIDARRIDLVINERHIKRPIDLATMKEIWTGISKNSKYTWRLIEVLKERYTLPKDEALELLPDYEEMTKWFDENPELGARMWQSGQNDIFKPRHFEENSDPQCEESEETAGKDKQEAQMQGQQS